jgi:hypothetical protein
VVVLSLVTAAVLVIAASASDRPMVGDVYVTALRDTPQTFVVVAQDSAIDPLHPSAHPLRFVLLGGPSHGVLSGDLTAVVVDPPHEARVALTYIPAVGYVGRDAMTLVAVDGFGNTSEPATMEVSVIAERAPGVLAGAWDAEWTIDVQSAAITAFSQRLTEVYRVGMFLLTGIAEFQMESTGGPMAIQFDALRFESEAAVGPLRVKATLAFDPKESSASELFDYLLTHVGADLFDISLSHTLFLTRPQTESYQTLIVGGAVGDVTLTNTVRLDLGEDCGFAFSRDDLQATWAWCGAALRVAAGVTSAGFESATVGAQGIPIPRFSWLPGDVTADVVLTFRPTAKTVSAGVDWDPGIVGCVRILGELATGAGSGVVDQAVLYGLVLECDVTPFVHVKSATSFDLSKNATVTGQVDYFESLALSGDLESCCGVPGTWSAVTYFRSPSSQLFDWGMTVMKADIGISEHFSVRFDLAVRSGELGDPLSEFTIGWTARW